ncbi:unnamed protein product [Calicophoron daubneyi]|uniref:ATP-dependent RNA helicase n=1 Tax=Calicophoron daubneyi TaxID=300641 RepID=A0AAV2TA31_CALDB
MKQAINSSENGGSCPSKEDTVIGGFTVISDKSQSIHVKPQEILPYWITHCTTFPSDLKFRKNVNVIKGLSENMRSHLFSIGCSELFPVQYSAIPVILKSYRTKKHRPLCRPRDICISAPTGSGKTLAYAVPSVQLLLGRKNVCFRILVVLPVRDLAIQVFDVFQKLVANTDLKVGLLSGIKGFTKEQAEILDNSTGIPVPKVDIIVATPGRLVDHLYNTDGFSMERLRILVIDEADRVIKEEKQDWYRALEDALYQPAAIALGVDFYGNKEHSNVHRCRPLLTIAHQYDTSHDITLQKILVSATLTHDPGPLKRFNLYFPLLLASASSIEANTVAAGLENEHSCTVSRLTQSSPTLPKKLTGKEDEENKNIPTDDMKTLCTYTERDVGGVGVFTTPPGLKEFLVSVPVQNRPLFLMHLIRHRHVQRILCFTNARDTTNRLYSLFKAIADTEVSKLSAEMHPAKRKRILDAFSRGDLNLLICTDTMARGMDIKGVDCVVSYDVPSTVRTYVHRVGRTARAGQTGMAFTLINKSQFHFFKRDLRAVGKRKVKEVVFHQSQMSDLQADYQAALKVLRDSGQNSEQPTADRTSRALGRGSSKHAGHAHQDEKVDEPMDES